MKLKSNVLAISVLVILFGGILLSSGLGWWQTESSKEAATFTEGEFAGMPNPADIRGSYTFGDVQANFGVPAEVLAQAFQVETSDPAAFPVKELEAQYEDSAVEIGTASVRLFVALYTGLPYDLTVETSYLPDSAVQLLQTRELTAEQNDYLASHTVTLDTLAAPEAAVETAPVVEEEESDTFIRGKTTFAEVLSWGVTREQIEAVLGLPMPAENLTVIKDFVLASGLDFESVKTELQAVVDAR
ncbi:hypothetical protein [Pelolinea submarina]|uniref:Uncharacterized protein n=1 Tax=Pelolinea submarina TaxID=913107 RepID=A0A347ZSG5_9CHLR|nr:hypothetical protein [Pelolinea submarina]REG11188.1 hypothetical protein DFR64_1065 [Pelolinea submarina]BBB48246.1 hypothetical protein Pelsub_P1474 [Pelolinea submarina]